MPGRARFHPKWTYCRDMCRLWGGFVRLTVLKAYFFAKWQALSLHSSPMHSAIRSFGRISAPLAALLAAGFSVPAQAKTTVYETVFEEWIDIPSDGYRFMSPLLEQAEVSAIGTFGPFIVRDSKTAALVDITDSQSPAAFQAMIAAFPNLETLQFIEAPGTFSDRDNLKLGRMIRGAGLATYVPEGGSVRSGAVELFLGGVRQEIADGAEFAVHAWLDESGRSASDYRAGSAEHAKYLTYYRDMGMSADNAAAFYAMTNSVAFDDALWLDGPEMRKWLVAPQMEQGPKQKQQAPRLAYLDLGAALN